MNKTVLILGGGPGGIVAAHELRKRVGDEHSVTVIDRKATHHLGLSLLWLMVGEREPEGFTRDLSLLRRKGIEFVQDEVTAIEPSEQKVFLKAHPSPLRYDYLIIALGAEYDWQAFPGLAEAAYSFYDLDGSLRLRETLPKFEGGHIVIVIPRTPYKCPGAPHEAAMLLEAYFRQRGIRERVKISIYTVEPQPMPVAGPEMGKAVVQMHQEKGIAFHPNKTLQLVDAANRTLTFADGETVAYDLLIAIPPHRAPEVVRQSGLASETGYIPVDRQTLRTRFENVFAIGDVNAVSLPGRWKPEVPLMLPKAAVFASAQGEVVAKNITAEILGEEPTATFNGEGWCILELGDNTAAMGAGNFFTTPNPTVQLHPPNRWWHEAKVWFEGWWLSRWF